MSDTITIENGTTGRLRFGKANYHVGIRPRGERFEVAYQGSAPARYPMEVSLDDEPMRAIERLKSANGWIVLVLERA